MNPVYQPQLHPLLRIVLMLIAGIIVGERWGLWLPAWEWLAVAAVPATGALLLPGRWGGIRTAGIMMATMLVGVALIGHTLERTAPVQTQDEVDFEAVVTSQPVVRGKTLRCDLLITSMGGRRLAEPIEVKGTLLRDTLHPGSMPLEVGSALQTRSALTQPDSFATAGHFDYPRWLRVHGFRAETFIVPWRCRPAQVRLSSLGFSHRLTIKARRLRTYLLQQYVRLGFSDQQYAVLAAMTLGDKSMLSRQVRADYATAGASHVLALSGLHLSIIYGLLVLLFPRRRRWQWLAQSAIVASLWLFVLLVGLPSSAVRSAAMLTVYSLCAVTGRQGVSVNALSFAALVLLVSNPLCLYDVGFQLSFLAVFALLIGYTPVYHLLSPRFFLARWLWGLTVVSVLAQVATAPLVAYYFGQVSFSFLVSNLIVVPAATLLLYGVVALLASSPLPLVQQAVATVLNTLATLLNTTLHRLAHLPGANISGIHFSAVQVLLVYLLLALACIIVACLVRQRELRKLDTMTK